MASNRRKAFTLLEILIAMSIFLIGAAAIVVLFPVGIRAVRDVSYDTYGGLAAREAMATIKTVGAAENIYVHYNQLYPSGPVAAIPPPWHFPWQAGLFRLLNAYYAGKDVVQIYDGQGLPTQFSWGAVLYPMGYEWNPNAVPPAPSATGPFHEQALYNCQVAAYRNYSQNGFYTGTVNATSLLTPDSAAGHPYPAQVLWAINNVISPAGAAVAQAQFSDVFVPGRYVQLQVMVAGPPNPPLYVWGLWYRIRSLTYSAAPPPPTLPGYIITLDQPFYSIGPWDQDTASANWPGSHVYVARGFRVSSAECVVIGAFDTLVGASGEWIP